MNFIPSKKEEKEMKELVNSILKKIKVKDAKPVLGGSGAKGTWLPGVHDIDIYVKFDYNKYNNKSSKLSDILEKSLKKSFSKVERLHGSRDYFQIKMKNFTIEVVPILNIKKAEQAKNITDVSQLHVNYVNKFPKLKNDIRKAKMFFRAAEVYGAESHIQGFSGYMVELLVINYRGFSRMVRNIAKWKEKTMIGNKRDINVMNDSKKTSPLIFVDPVDSSRNAAAALSEEIYNKVIKACRKYSKNPSEKFFKAKEFNLNEIKRNYNLVFEAKPSKKGKHDVVGASLRKDFERLSRKLEENDFRIIKKGWHWDNKAYFYFKLKSPKLPKEKEIIGPPLKMRDACSNFRKYHRKTYVKKGRLCTRVRRKITEAKKIKL